MAMVLLLDNRLSPSAFFDFTSQHRLDVILTAAYQMVSREFHAVLAKILRDRSGRAEIRTTAIPSEFADDICRRAPTVTSHALCGFGGV